jgi:hypothetical protein
LRDDGHFTFTLDIRGAIKPPLTPAREPLSVHNRLSPRAGKWETVNELVSQAQGRIWEQVAIYLDAITNPELFWQLGIIYGKGWSWFAWMRASACWQYLSVPVLDKNKSHEWIAISSLDKLYPKESLNTKEEDEYGNWSDDSYNLYTGSGKKINSYEALTRWGTYDINKAEDEDEEQPDPGEITTRLNETVLCMATLFLESNEVLLRVLPPTLPDTIPHKNIMSLRYASRDLIAINYAGEAFSFFSVHAPCPTINRNHPLTQFVLQGAYAEKPT